MSSNGPDDLPPPQGADLRQRCIETLVERFLIDDESAAPLADAVLDTIGAETLADQTLLRGLTVGEGGLNLELIPPRQIAAYWVHAAIGMLGDAPNYSETRVDYPKATMEISPAGSFDRYALIVQRVGKLTPHEARVAAEQRAELAEERLALARHALLKDGYFTADEIGDDIAPRVTEVLSEIRDRLGRAEAELASAQARIDRLRELHRPATKTVHSETTITWEHCASCGLGSGWPCPTIRTLDGREVTSG